jgi:hypothetical protein
VIQKRRRQGRDGKRYTVYRVRFYDDDGRERSKTFRYAKDAKAFEAKARIAKRTGELDSIDAGRVTLDLFAERWWERYAIPNLEYVRRGCGPYTAHEGFRRMRADFSLALQSQADARIRTGDPFITR